MNDTQILTFLLSLGEDKLYELITRRLAGGMDLETGIISIFEKADGIHFYPDFHPDADINIDLLSIGYCCQILFNALSMNEKDKENYIQSFIDTTTSYNASSIKGSNIPQ